MDNTIIMQGNFTGTGSPVFIPLRAGVDWIEVFNSTVASGGPAIGSGFQFSWQEGMPQGQGFAFSNPAAPIMAPLAAGTGFFFQDQSIITNTISPAAITSIVNNGGVPNLPRVTSAGHGLLTGDIVRLVNTLGARQLDGIDFRVTNRTANTFDLSWMAPIVAANAPGANARFYKISNESIYQPRQRVITIITQAAQAVVTFAAPHNFTIGQEIRFKIPVKTPVAFGMTQLNNVVATVLAVDIPNNTVTINVDTTGFTAFAFPLTADVAFTPAQAVPVGEDTATANFFGIDPLGDAVFNNAQIGMLLQSGVLSPAGALNDQIFWRAGVSFSVEDEF
jgi:hypothetical protein